MTPPRLHHAHVFYSEGEEAAARRFYGGLLGLPEIERPLTLADRASLSLRGGRRTGAPLRRPDLGLHPRRQFALRVDDLDALVARLRAAGARFEEAIPIPGWRRLYVFDPFGNKIELDEIP